MDEKAHEKKLEALNDDITKSREEIAVLSAVLKKLMENARDNSEGGGWTGFREGLGDAGAKGEKVVKYVADNIERHPLISGLAAFGLGFGIATLLFKTSKTECR